MLTFNKYAERLSPSDDQERKVNTLRYIFKYTIHVLKLSNIFDPEMNVNISDEKDETIFKRMTQELSQIHTKTELQTAHILLIVSISNSPF